MKKIIFTFLLFVFLAKILFSGETGFSADVERLANISVVEENKPYLLFYTPCGLDKISVPEIFVNYASLYPNLTDGTVFVNNSVGFVKEFYGGGIGIGLNQFGIKDYYTKNTFVVSYGRNLKDVEDIPEYIKSLRLGLKIKILSENYSIEEALKENPVFSGGTQKNTVSISLSSQYSIENNIFGVAFENLNRPNTALKYREDLPLEISVGYKHIFGKLNFLLAALFENNPKSDFTINSAAEYNIIVSRKIKFAPSVGLGFGSRNFSMLYTGFLFQTSLVGISYSFSIDPLQKIDTGAQQYLSFSYRFSPAPVYEEKVSKKEYDKLVLEKEAIISEKNAIQAERDNLLKEITVLRQKLQQMEVARPEATPPTTEQQKSEPSLDPSLLLKKIAELEEKLKSSEAQKTFEKPKTAPQPVIEQPPQKRFHKVVAGDTLPGLASKYYNDSSQWKKIYDANRTKITGGQLTPGTILEIP